MCCAGYQSQEYQMVLMQIYGRTMLVLGKEGVRLCKAGNENMHVLHSTCEEGILYLELWNFDFISAEAVCELLNSPETISRSFIGDLKQNCVGFYHKIAFKRLSFDMFLLGVFASMGCKEL